jgi:hypothetical protein
MCKARATGEIRAGDLYAEWIAAHPAQEQPYAFREDDFLAWVSRKGLIEPIDSFEWHVDCGSRVEACDALNLISNNLQETPIS